jgi:nitrite reductase (NO-forming)
MGIATLWRARGTPEAAGSADAGLTHTVVAMVAVLALVAASVAVGVALYADPDAAGTSAASTPSAAEQIDFSADPGPDWKPFDAALAPAAGGTEHAVTLRASEQPVEIAPGVTQEMWTYNGQVPGPVLRGRVGDVFTITLVNEGKNGHSIDFHASEVAPDDEMRTIGPGESLVYQFTATHAGVWLYHCGTPPVLHHTGNGMYGAVIIDPPDLGPVDRELVFVQSDLYLDGVTAEGYRRMQEARWDAVVFNGYANQYAKAPIRVEPEQKVRAWVVNAGPSADSTFHVIGTIFDTVYREGHYELRPDADRGGAQALDLQPAQGGFVEFTLAERGSYPFLTHRLADSEHGALGIFQAGEPRAEGGGHGSH